MSPSMRTQFGHHHRLSDQERDTLLKAAVFVLDTNVLLNIYRYAEGTRNDLFKVLETVKDRLWIPYYVAHEFYKNRLEVIRDQKAKYTAVSETLDKAFSAISDPGFRRSGFLKVEQLEAILSPAVARAKEFITAQQKTHPNLIHEDPFLDRLAAIVGDSLGQAPAPDLLEAWHKEAKARIESMRPPGYRDAKKPEPERYGDVLIWFELLDLAGRLKRPVVLITDDDKDDWWLVIAGEKLGPQPALRQEMFEKAGVDFFLYKPALFLEHIGAQSRVAISASSIVDARETADELRRQIESLLASTRVGPSALTLPAVEPPVLARQSERAVITWLATTYPDATIIADAGGTFDLLIATAQRVAGVEIQAIRGLSRHAVLRRIRDIALRAHHEIRSGRISAAAAIFVALDAQAAFTVSQGLEISQEPDPSLPTIIGYLAPTGEFLEFSRLYGRDFLAG